MAHKEAVPMRRYAGSIGRCAQGEFFATILPFFRFFVGWFFYGGRDMEKKGK